MSQFRVEKRRADAELTFATGATLRGSFFLASATPTQVGPERIADLLNASAGFFPFDAVGDADQGTILVNRAHIVAVRLLEPFAEAQDDPGYEVATERYVVMTLANGARLEGSVRVYCPQGRDRLSDWARSAEAFRQGHIDGAVNLAFPDFTAQSLAAALGDPNTRILIYCNNNFENNAAPVMLKRIDLALNIQTFINLYGYGYRNVYELGDVVNFNDPAVRWVRGS